ncbi:MAG: c-type cytochrome domain-containing protein, partial [Planctomyces sp.]
MSLVIRITLIVFTVLIRPVAGQTDPDFDRDVAPVLLSRCLECHQNNNPSGGLSLETAADQRRGGDSGPALIPGNAAGSLLLARVLAAEMPPPANGHA